LFLWGIELRQLKNWTRDGKAFVITEVSQNRQGMPTNARQYIPDTANANLDEEVFETIATLQRVRSLDEALARVLGFERLACGTVPRSPAGTGADAAAPTPGNRAFQGFHVPVRQLDFELYRLSP